MQSSEIELRKHCASVVMKRICLSSHYVVFCLFVCFLFFCCFSIVGVRKLQLSCSTATVKHIFCAFLNCGNVGSLVSFVILLNCWSTNLAQVFQACLREYDNSTEFSDSQDFPFFPLQVQRSSVLLLLSTVIIFRYSTTSVGGRNYEAFVLFFSTSLLRECGINSLALFISYFFLPIHRLCEGTETIIRHRYFLRLSSKCFFAIFGKSILLILQ